MSRLSVLPLFIILAIIGFLIFIHSSLDVGLHLFEMVKSNQSTLPVQQRVENFRPKLAVNAWSEIAVQGDHCIVEAYHQNLRDKANVRYVYLQSMATVSQITVVWKIRDHKLDEFRARYGNCMNAQVVSGILVELTEKDRIRRLYKEQTQLDLTGQIYLAEPVLSSRGALIRFKWVQAVVYVLFGLVVVVLFSLVIWAYSKDD